MEHVSPGWLAFAWFIALVGNMPPDHCWKSQVARVIFALVSTYAIYVAFGGRVFS